MRKPSISREDVLRRMSALMEQGSSCVNARREIHEQFDVIEPVSVARSIIRVREIANDGGYPIELTPDTIELVVDYDAYIYLANGNEGLCAYTFDKGEPGSDRIVYAVMSGDGRVLGRHSTKEGAAKHIRAIISGEISEEPLDDSEDGHVNVIDSIGVAREGDEFVVKSGDGRILGRSRSKEKIMEILQAASERWVSDESSEDTSRFDIIEIE